MIPFSHKKHHYYYIFISFYHKKTNTNKRITLITLSKLKILHSDFSSFFSHHPTLLIENTVLTLILGISLQ